MATSPRQTTVICALLLAFFAGLAWAAVRTKSPTYDEPLHAMAAWLQWHRGDFRMDPENPPLWKFWAALPIGMNAISPPPTTEQIQGAADSNLTAPYVIPVLFRSPGTDPEAIIRRGRLMMLIVAVGLGALVAWWSWRLGGEIAAIVATAAFALDPNFLAHAALIKNDVVLALVFLGLIAAVWHAGRRVTCGNTAAIALLCAAALNIKFFSLIFGPIVVLLLLVRALMPLPWDVLGRTLNSRAARFAAAVALCALALLVSYAAIWACYGFRFSPTPDGQFHLSTQRLVSDIARLQGHDAGPALRAVLFAQHHHLLPEAWTNGLISTYQVSLAHSNFFAGRISRAGWWYYFPVAMAVKSPLMLILASVLALPFLRQARSHMWTSACLAIPPIVYLLLAMNSNLQYGVRHILPIYPFLFIALGLAAARLWNKRRTLAAIAIGVYVLGLSIESLAAFPNYIAYFNFASGGSRGGFNILGDSNLDWGQDLKLLADWQRRHLDKQLYLAYWGVADPAYYGIRYKSLPGGLGPPSDASALKRDGGNAVFAVSATILQGIYLPDDLRRYYDPLRQSPPTDVLGGSIYLFDLSDR